MKRRIAILLFLVAGLLGSAQEAHPPFWEDIQAFKKADSLHFPGKGKILFVGSSSFTKWTDVQKYFPEHPIINRGFGGSSLPDVIRYSEDVIFKYDPQQIVIYCGENDLAANDSVSAQTVISRFKDLFILIRSRLRNTPIVFVSLKPSPSRAHLMPKMLQVNAAIKEFLKKKARTAFIDVYHHMLEPDGTPIKSIFIEDDLHMNEKGYAIWQKLLEPYLKR